MNANNAQNPTSGNCNGMNTPTCSCTRNRPYALQDPDFTYEYECILHGQQNVTSPNLPALRRGRSIVFGMDRPADWDTLDDTARQARRRQALTHLFGAQNLWFEEDRSDLRKASRITVWRNDYYGSFEIVEHKEFEEFLQLGHTILRGLLQMTPAEIDELPIRESEYFRASVHQREVIWQNYVQPRLHHAIHHRVQPSVLSNDEIQQILWLIGRGHHFFRLQETDRLFRGVLVRAVPPQPVPVAQPAFAPRSATPLRPAGPARPSAPAQPPTSTQPPMPAQLASTVISRPAVRPAPSMRPTPAGSPRDPESGNSDLASRLPRPAVDNPHAQPAAIRTVNPAMTMDQNGLAYVTGRTNDPSQPRPHPLPTPYHPHSGHGQSDMPGPVLGGILRVPGHPAATPNHPAHQPRQAARNVTGYGQNAYDRSLQNTIGLVQPPRLITPRHVAPHQHHKPNLTQTGPTTRNQTLTFGTPQLYNVHQPPSQSVPAPLFTPRTYSSTHGSHGVRSPARSQSPPVASASLPRRSSNAVSSIPRAPSSVRESEFEANEAFGATLFDRRVSEGRTSTSTSSGSTLRRGTVKNRPASQYGSPSRSQQGSLSPVRPASLQTRTPSLSSQSSDAANVPRSVNQPGVVRDPVTGQLIVIPRSGHAERR